mgnify:CR=1 FL=1
MRIYCFGNRMLEQDSLPLLLIPELRKEFPNIEFIEANSPDDIEDQAEINILDTVKGISSVAILSDIEGLCSNRSCSLHDFDLGMTLKLMRKMGKLKKIRIIGIPICYERNAALSELKKAIKQME